MIKRLKVKFILLTMVTLFLLLAFMITGMNILNYNSILQDADAVLTLLGENEGAFPELPFGPPGKMPERMTPETPYESRYFSVLLDTSSNITQVNTSRIAAIDGKTAISYARKALERNATTGFIDHYRYRIDLSYNTIRITFLDCSTKISSFRHFLYASIIMALCGYIGVFFAIFFFSGRIIRPIAESYEKQKRFITDAGHEIKTPLTIINADADVLEMDLGESEWLDDIRLQTKRLTALTNELVYLSRMEESDTPLTLAPIPFSEIVSQTAHSFQSLAQTQGKTFLCNIQPLLSINGDEKSTEQLVSILLDNALKYSPPGGMVTLDVCQRGKSVQMEVFNTTTDPVEKDKLSLIFDRFYRLDSSRSTQTGGYGIGLSLAKAIVNAHNGRISVATMDGHSLQILVQFPLL